MSECVHHWKPPAPNAVPRCIHCGTWADELRATSDAVASDPVSHPPHYTWLGGIEVIDITEHMGFCLGNVVKYVLRADHKGQPIQDLEKAAWYLEREIRNRKANPPHKPGGQP